MSTNHLKSWFAQPIFGSDVPRDKSDFLKQIGKEEYLTDELPACPGCSSPRLKILPGIHKERSRIDEGGGLKVERGPSIGAGNVDVNSNRRSE